jgi:serine/threonine-protein kinase RsbT
VLPQPRVVQIRSDLDIVTARQVARDIAKSIGFGAIDQARIATAVSELARNIVVHARQGQMTARVMERSSRKGLELEFADEGPGIADIEQAMQDGYSTARSMGMGLPGARRLMDEFKVQSTVGVGTTVVCGKWCK